jgi:RimJ/RimL family protein N-acetyltransferase
MSNKKIDFNLDVFIEGETINLCLANENFAKNSSWYSWFNNFKTTRFLEQGIFPNSPSEQLDFFQSVKGSNRLSLIISDKENYLGTISLSSIDLYKRTADIALLFGEKSDKKDADLMALEAMALITEHGFKRMGLRRISAGQHVKLERWQRKMEVIGYKVEGLNKNGFLKGDECADAVAIAILEEDYHKICNSREGIWDSAEAIRGRISKLPETSFISKLKKFMAEEAVNYYDEVFML